MPNKTERQHLTEELAQMIAMAKFMEMIDEDSDSEDASDDDGDDDFDDDVAHASTPVSELLIRGLISIHSRRYMNDRRKIPKSKKTLELLLGAWKVEYPDFFRSYLRVTPSTFDALETAIETDAVFQNNSELAEQFPVSWQLAITLYRFGHFGNGVSVRKVGLMFGLGFGTVVKSTKRVIVALCRDHLRMSAIRWPTAEEKERAKAWVEEKSCAAWRDGWVMVDGTLVPLFARPAHFGNSWYDRKANYSLNVQLITTPDMKIVDYRIGLPGSQHDATAWKRTRIPNEHATLLPNHEWCWADSAYPLQKWLIAPYKAPAKFEGRNKEFNFHVSTVRVKSEHSVGYWKGRCSSLRGLRLRIDKQDDIAFATYWMIACMVVHNFAMEHERNINFELDAFFRDGMNFVAEDRRQLDALLVDADARDIELQQAEARRCELKEALYRHLDGAESSEDSS